jgi:hypothetical protein
MYSICLPSPHPFSRCRPESTTLRLNIREAGAWALGVRVWGLNDTNFSVMNQKQRALVRGGCLAYLYSYSKEYYDLRGKGNRWIKM